MRTLLTKVIRNRRCQRRLNVAQRASRGGRRLHRQCDQVRLSCGVAAQQVRRHRGRRNSQGWVSVEQAAHQLLTKRGGKGTWWGDEGEWMSASATQMERVRRWGGDFFVGGVRARVLAPPPSHPQHSPLSSFSPGGTGVTVASSSICTLPLRKHRLRSTASPAARSCGVGARSAVRSKACTTGRGRPTTVMLARASAVWAAACPSISLASVCMACECVGGEGVKRKKWERVRPARETRGSAQPPSPHSP